ncbi:MAG: cytochrome c [Alphaproteobacteria bacterium]|jgi:cytochrome c556|nr:cytochrome c [Alphaproteobacteria bacterium]MBT7943253.1 cytochrome c [Alphaproteobacteria bacterium]
MKISSKILVLPLVLLAFVAMPALAQEEGAIKHRQSVMKAVGGHMGAMAAILKGQVPFTKDLKGHAHAMAELAKIAARVFPEGSDFGETRAKEDVWSKPKEFAKVVQAFITESAKLAKVSEGGDMAAFGAQFKAMGKNACGACHKAFREKKQ